MRRSFGANEHSNTSDYCRQKLTHLESMRRLVGEERIAIETSDLEALNKMLNRREELQQQIDRLDELHKTSNEGKVSTKLEKSIIFRILKEISDIDNENQRILLSEKEHLAMELEAMRMKKKALQAYGSSGERKAFLNKSR